MCDILKCARFKTQNTAVVFSSTSCKVLFFILRLEVYDSERKKDVHLCGILNCASYYFCGHIPTTFLSWDGWRWSVGVYSIQRVVEHLQVEFPDRRVVKKQQQHLGQSEVFLQTFYCLPQTSKPSISIYINISCPKTSSGIFLLNINWVSFAHQIDLQLFSGKCIFPQPWAHSTLRQSNKVIKFRIELGLLLRNCL